MMASAVFGWLSVVPPVLAIATALATRRVLPSLLAGIICAGVIINHAAAQRVPSWIVDYTIGILARPDNLRLVAFSVLVGGLLKLMKDARAFEAFAAWLQSWRGSYGKRTAFGLTWLFGATLILETWSNVLINAATTGPLYDRLGLSRARLAYFIHTIGINVVALVLINSWGAFYLALLQGQGVANPIGFLVEAMPYALYCWLSLIMVGVVMASGLTIGPMRRFDVVAAIPPAPVAQLADGSGGTARLRHMVIPIVTLIAGVLLSLWATGDGNMTAGDGSASILYAVIGTIAVTAVLLYIDGVFGSKEIEQKIIEGSAQFFDVGLLIVLALALGRVTQDLGTGAFVAQLMQASLPVVLIPALVFVIGAVMSFATGTSYGTFSIMVPIALPIGAATGISPELLFGACIAGGVFGDNCSPISDTTIVTSIAAGTTVVDHASTQLPYALISAALAIAGYVGIGIFL